MNSNLVTDNPELTYVPKKKGRRRRPSTGRRIILACLCAVLVFAAVIGGLYYMGYRYEKVELENGEVITFLGMIKDGEPVKGRITYSNGLVGELDGETGVITYTNGSRYKGELGDDFRKNGHGALTFASGNIYEGSFKSDAMTGIASLKYANGDTY
ncbi:MAG: hypothetical protein IJN63_05990, partial [Clostridia bacterium]|nr:hypothetical protein [Clostridia bacterium]